MPSFTGSRSHLAAEQQRWKQVLTTLSPPDLRSNASDTARGQSQLSFTIGICATDESRTLASLVERLQNETYPQGLHLVKIVVVASGCSEEALLEARKLAQEDRRISLIEERERHGKAEAINRIVGQFQGDYLVFVNGDALPFPGSASKLLETISNDRSIGAVSGAPTFNAVESATSQALKLMWTVHNECSASLNDKGIGNHGSDELLVLRSDAVVTLPRGLVNDGGYLTGMAALRGYMIKIRLDAPVKISVPRRFSAIVRQRRRIIFGHIQVWRLIGQSPLTVESMLFKSPLLGLKIIIRNLSRNPKMLRWLPVVAVQEILAALGAILDTVTSTQRHAVWDRYED